MRSRPFRPLRGVRPLLLAALLPLLAGCGEPQAWGEDNSLIVVAEDSLWQEVADTTYAILEPTFFTTRDEKRYVVTQVDPANEDQLEDLVVFKQVLVFGTPDDPLVREAAEEAGLEQTPEPPAVFQARNVWARGQVVTAAVLEPGRRAASWRSLLPEVLAAVDSTFRELMRTRMFITGPDTAIAREFRERFGFGVTIPNVWDHVVRTEVDGEPLEAPIIILRNDNPDPSQLIRQVTITWRSRVDSLTADLAYEWRAAIDSVHYNVPQGIDRERGRVTRFLLDSHQALEATGVWEDEEGVPAGGPFIVWLVQCPERTFFLDAWLYAPGEGDGKYAYVLQLQRVLDSFSCPGGTGGATGAGTVGPDTAPAAADTAGGAADTAPGEVPGGTAPTGGA